MKVKNVSLTNMGFVVFLTQQNQDEVLPIFIGASEAHSISAVLNQQIVTRPLSHDLMKNVLTELDCQLEYILITKIEEDTFYAELVFENNGKQMVVDARPSDAIALALRYKKDIYTHRKVINEALVNLESEKEDKPAVDNLKNQHDVYKEAMNKAIAEERYEDAAKLRDQLKSIQKTN